MVVFPPLHYLNEGCWMVPFGCGSPSARLLDRVGNLLLVGDSLQDELEHSIYNALYMDQPGRTLPTASLARVENDDVTVVVVDVWMMSGS